MKASKICRSAKIAILVEPDDNVFMVGPMTDPNFTIPEQRNMGLSASKLEAIYQCTAKFKAEFIDKRIPFVETEATKKGKITHTTCEKAIETSGESLTTISDGVNDYTLERLADVICAPGEKFAEYKFGINTAMNMAVRLANNWDKQPNGQPYLYTGSMDVRVVNGIYTTIMDWKTGKVYQKSDKGYEPKFNKDKINPIEAIIAEKRLQMDLYALAEFMLNPECQYIQAIYVFTTYEQHQEFRYERSKDYQRLWQIFFDEARWSWWRIKQWQEIGDMELPGTVTALCNWCPIKKNCLSFQTAVKANLIVEKNTNGS